MKFNLDGTMKRERSTPCKQCGEMKHCDDCWEHVRDESPFGVWHCLLCHMPMVTYDHTWADVMRPHRCDFCGWDEATECEAMIFDEKTNTMIKDTRDYGESKGPPR